MQRNILLNLSLNEYCKPTGKDTQVDPERDGKDQFLDESWWNRHHKPRIQLIQEDGGLLWIVPYAIIRRGLAKLCYSHTICY
jgi:hypothetical protein